MGILWRTARSSTGHHRGCLSSDFRLWPHLVVCCLSAKKRTEAETDVCHSVMFGPFCLNDVGDFVKRISVASCAIASR